MCVFIYKYGKLCDHLLGKRCDMFSECWYLIVNRVYSPPPVWKEEFFFLITPFPDCFPLCFLKSPVNLQYVPDFQLSSFSSRVLGWNFGSDCTIS